VKRLTNEHGLTTFALDRKLHRPAQPPLIELCRAQAILGTPANRLDCQPVIVCLNQRDDCHLRRSVAKLLDRR
jgi:hypothetical protein